MITHDHFNMDALDRFWYFIAERQRVWCRRTNGVKPPWTDDPIIQREHFTNIYRELDPGTTFVFKNFLNNGRLSRSEKAWHVLNYRLTGSNRFVYKSVFPVHIRRWDPDHYRMLMHNAAEVGVKVWGSAYTVTGAVCAKGESKIDAIARVIDTYTQDWSGVWRGMSRAPHMEESYKAILSLYGFGPFTAYQSLIDMLYKAEDGSQVLPWHPNDWATLGLGAKQGIKRLLSPEHQRTKPLEVLRWLVDNQAREFKRVGEKFPYLKEPDGRLRLLNLQTFQTCLCESWKYSRMYFEGQRGQRHFKKGLKS
jgi:hypothetical protein